MASFHQDTYTISTDKNLLDLDSIVRYLSKDSYWAAGVSRDIVQKSIQNSLCFGVYEEMGETTKQIGFARLITDMATFAYLADVFILPEYRGLGLSKWLMASIVSMPELQGLRRWLLATRDAHGLYAQYGFTPLDKPDRFMQKYNPDIYLNR